MARLTLPRPVFNVVEEIYKRKWQQHLHFCRAAAADMNPRSFAASGIRMSEALAEAARELTPSTGRRLGSLPSLREYEAMGTSLCAHGLLPDAEHFGEFLEWHWGKPEKYNGDGTVQEPIKLRTGLIVFQSKGTAKKADNAAMVRGNNAVCLWDGDSNLGPSYWNATEILFWELQREGSRKGSGTRLAGPVTEKEVLAPMRSTPKEEKDELVPEIAPEDKKNPNIYCPNYYERAPKHYIERMEEVDLRNYSDENANQDGKQAYRAATQGQPGGQTYWGGAGRKKATSDRRLVQEGVQGGGARELERMTKKDRLLDGAWKEEGLYDELGKEESGITNERLWKTISMRSAENAEGDVTAYVAGGAGAKDRVFDSVELPTLLHNTKIKKLTFKDPEGKVPDTVWEKDENNCWKGPDVPGGELPAKNDDGSYKYKDGKQVFYNNPGFSLDPKKGFVRVTNKPKGASPPT